MHPTAGWMHQDKAGPITQRPAPDTIYSCLGRKQETSSSDHRKSPQAQEKCIRKPILVTANSTMEPQGRTLLWLALPKQGSSLFLQVPLGQDHVQSQHPGSGETLGHSKESQHEDLEKNQPTLAKSTGVPIPAAGAGLQCWSPAHYLSAASNMCWQALPSLTFP